MSGTAQCEMVETWYKDAVSGEVECWLKLEVLAQKVLVSRLRRRFRKVSEWEITEIVKEVLLRIYLHQAEFPTWRKAWGYVCVSSRLRVLARAMRILPRTAKPFDIPDPRGPDPAGDVDRKDAFDVFECTLRGSELKVFRLLRAGCTDRSVISRLTGLSPRTVSRKITAVLAALEDFWRRRTS